MSAFTGSGGGFGSAPGVGLPGVPGPAGVGLPPAGATNQILRKSGPADYAVFWDDETVAPPLRGERGPKGEMGSIGRPGRDSNVPGPRGRPGPAGPIGKEGTQGVPGRDGVDAPMRVELQRLQVRIAQLEDERTRWHLERDKFEELRAIVNALAAKIQKLESQSRRGF
jgi:hypothetical protein